MKNYLLNFTQKFLPRSFHQKYMQNMDEIIETNLRNEIINEFQITQSVSLIAQ